MKYVIAALFLTGCSSVTNYNAPENLSAVHSDVMNRASYRFHVTTVETAHTDRTTLKAGDAGNCYQFATTFQHELMQRGITGMLKTCTLWHGIGHAYVVTVDGWVLDNRQQWVVRESDVGCN